MKTISILGLGLMGGSLGLAARKAGLASRIKGYARRPESLRKALEIGAIDEATECPADAVRDAQIVVICVPILSIPSLLDSCKPGLATGCVVTDVGSTKAELVSLAESILEDSPAEFVGSHPMAGSEQAGLDAARHDLYTNAAVIVTDTERTDRESAQAVMQFWQSLGASVTVMKPFEHDKVVAKTSHLPHVVASALVKVVLESDGENRRALCASGFRDTTRVAAGSENMWHDIVRTNHGAISDEVRAMIRVLEQFLSWMKNSDYDRVREFLANARTLRETVKGE